MSTVGVIEQDVLKVEVKWNIPKFLSLLEGKYYGYKSPDFPFSDSSWYLKIIPNNYSNEPSKGWIEFALYRNQWESTKTLECTLELKMENVLLEAKRITKNIILKSGSSYFIFLNFLERSVLLNHKLKDKNSCCVIITCTLKSGESLSEDRCLKSLQNVSRNIKDILKKKDRSDVILKVQGCEIPAHRLILEARSSVFAAMFAHDMDENRTGVVRIDDVPEDVFRCVLSYIYSGQVEGMSSQNVRSVYVAADKYDLQDLKEFCIIFMKENISVDLICDILAITDIYKEASLKEFSKMYFVKNSVAIMKTDEWNVLKKENVEIVLELLEGIVEKNASSITQY